MPKEEENEIAAFEKRPASSAPVRFSPPHEQCGPSATTLRDPALEDAGRLLKLAVLIDGHNDLARALQRQ